MSSRVLSPVAYVVIDIILIGFTILTIGLSFVEASPAMHLIGGLAIAVVKASLVVLFFMHALTSPAQTRAVIVVSIIWLIGVLMLLTLSDYLTRGLMPNLPGH